MSKTGVDTYDSPRLVSQGSQRLGIWNCAIRDRLQADVEVHCALTADGIACQPGQEEPGAPRVLVESSPEFASQPDFLFPRFDRPSDESNDQSQQTPPVALSQRCTCNSEQHAGIDRVAKARIGPGTNERMTSADGNRRAPICTKVGTRPDGQRDSARRQDDPDPDQGGISGRGSRNVPAFPGGERMRRSSLPREAAA